jgi:hypothetical protein
VKALRQRRVAGVLVVGSLLVGLAVWFTAESPAKAESFWVLGQLGVLVVAAIYAAAQVREVRLDREQRSRPFVVVDIDVWSKTHVLLLTIENHGQTVARDVQITFDPELQSTLDDPPGVVRPHGEWWPDVADYKIFREGIANLPPGKRLGCHLDIGPKLFLSDLPNRYVATVSYHGPTGTYNEEYVLDLAMYRDLPASLMDD